MKKHLDKLLTDMTLEADRHIAGIVFSSTHLQEKLECMFVGLSSHSLLMSYRSFKGEIISQHIWGSGWLHNPDNRRIVTSLF